MNRALFLDRDGIFNELVDHNETVWGAPRNWDEVKFYDGLDKLPQIKEMGFLLIMITNQPEIERKLLKEEFVKEMNSQLKEKYQLDAVYYCGYKSNDHPMKKPNPGMLQMAAEDFGLSLRDCYFLGDTERDVDAAKRVGCFSILWERSYNKDIKADFRVKSLQEVIDILSLAKPS